VGNIVGADVLNCLFVIGAAAAARPLAIPPNFYSFLFTSLPCSLSSIPFDTSYSETEMVVSRKCRELGF
jgi:Ca2+/Na+ antiporter